MTTLHWYRVRCTSHEPITISVTTPADAAAATAARYRLPNTQHVRLRLDPDTLRPLGDGWIITNTYQCVAKLRIDAIPQPQGTRNPGSGELPTDAHPTRTPTRRRKLA